MSRQVWILASLALAGCASSAVPVPEAPPSEISPVVPEQAAPARPAIVAEGVELRAVELRVGDASGVPVVALHGLGDRPEAFQGLFRGYTTPSLLVMPAAPSPHGQGYTWFSSRLRSSPVDVIRGEITAATDRVVALCKQVEARTGKRPAVTGFSQGGVLALSVAVQHPEAVVLSVPLSGWLPASMVPASAPAGAIPIRALHGTADEVLPLAETQSVVEALAKAGFDAELQAYEGVEHGLNAEMRARLFALLSEAP